MIPGITQPERQTAYYLGDWNLTGRDLKQLIYEAGFQSAYSAARYLDIDYQRMKRLMKMEQIPNGRLIALALLGVVFKSQIDKYEKLYGKIATKDKGK